MPGPATMRHNYPMTERVSLPPQVDEKEWEAFVRELRLARPWITAMAVINIIMGAIYLPFGLGSIAVGVILLLTESRLRRFLDGEAKALSAFAGQFRLYFVVSVVAVIATMVLYFVFILIYVSIIVLIAALFLALSAAGAAR